MSRRKKLSFPDQTPYRLSRSADELIERNISAIAALEREAKANRGIGAAIAARITAFCGSMSFAVLHVVLFAGWIYLNTWSNWPHIDPFPYTFLTLMVS